MQKRNYKPFGAAATIAAAFKNSQPLFQANTDTEAADKVLQELQEALSDDLAAILNSSSMLYILSCVTSLSNIPDRTQDFENLWQVSVEGLAALINDSSSGLPVEGVQALTKLISTTDSAALARKTETLQSVLVRICLECAKGTQLTESWDAFDAALTFNVFDDIHGHDLAKEITAILAKQPTAEAIKSLLLVAQIMADI